MSYKTILVHVDLGDAAPTRIRYAARLANQAGAHLIGAAPTGVSRFVPPEMLAAGLGPLAGRCRTLQEEAQQALDGFLALARQEGVQSYEARLIDDDADGGLPIAARYANLSVVGQPNPAIVDPLIPPDLPERLLLDSAHPVLVVPGAGDPPGFDGEALVAWNGDVGATRAVAGALPLLRLARRVTVLGIGDQQASSGLVEDDCNALVGWLGRHGIAARPRHRPQQDDIGAALLAEAMEIDAGLLVMGGYGHSRLRETVRDGVSANVLRWTNLPVLLAH
jgi:nucleotide-binding universal stress UspA family protein